MAIKALLSTEIPTHSRAMTAAAFLPQARFVPVRRRCRARRRIDNDRSNPVPALCTNVAIGAARNAPEWGTYDSPISWFVWHGVMLFFGLEFVAMRDIGAGAATARSRGARGKGRKKRRE